MTSVFNVYVRAHVHSLVIHGKRSNRFKALCASVIQFSNFLLLFFICAQYNDRDEFVLSVENVKN